MKCAGCVDKEAKISRLQDIVRQNDRERRDTDAELDRYQERIAEYEAKFPGALSWEPASLNRTRAPEPIPRYVSEGKHVIDRDTGRNVRYPTSVAPAMAAALLNRGITP